MLQCINLIHLIELTFNWFNALDYVFHTNIIAYCQQSRYVRFAIYTNLFILSEKKDSWYNRIRVTYGWHTSTYE